MKKSKTHKLRLLKDIYNGKFVTGASVGISNANQYLIVLEAEGLIIRETVKGKGGLKVARINPKKLDIVRELLSVKGLR